jgi:hypothetical protein
MTAVTIPPELAAEVEAALAEGGARLAAYRQDVDPHDHVLNLDAGDVCEVVGPAAGGTLHVVRGGVASSYLDAWALVGSVDGGPRPDFGRDVLVLNGDKRVIGQCGTYINDHGGALVIDCAEHTGTATRWALLPPLPQPAQDAPSAPLPATATPDPALGDAEGDSDAADVSQRALRNRPLVTCPRCGRTRPWTDGRSKAAGDDVDEVWCQTCSHEFPLPDPIPPGRWRTGTHWHAASGALATIVEAGAGDPHPDGRRDDDRLIGAIPAEDAARAVEAVNRVERYRARLEQPCGECHPCDAPALKAEVERLAAELERCAMPEGELVRKLDATVDERDQAREALRRIAAHAPKTRSGAGDTFGIAEAALAAPTTHWTARTASAAEVERLRAALQRIADDEQRIVGPDIASGALAGGS